MIKLSKRKIVAAALAIPAAGALALGGMVAVDQLIPERAQAAASTSLVADVSERSLAIVEGGSVSRRYTVAVGSAKYPTPRGTFAIRKIVWNPAWVPPDEKWARNKKPQPPGAKKNPMKVAKIFFQEPDYYIHGTGDIESLGDAASHGCIRMHPGEVDNVAALVMEAGGVQHGWSWIKSVLRMGETRTVYLKRPVYITVRT
jgi:lipoprotein-anchoring transpeptidase ErfK/SrfK